MNEDIRTTSNIDYGRYASKGITTIIFLILAIVLLCKIMIGGLDPDEVDYMNLPQEIITTLADSMSAQDGLSVGEVVMEISEDVRIQSQALQEASGFSVVIDGLEFFFVMVGDLGKLIASCLLNALRLIGAFFRLFGRVIE